MTEYETPPEVEPDHSVPPGIGIPHPAPLIPENDDEDEEDEEPPSAWPPLAIMFAICALALGGLAGYLDWKLRHLHHTGDWNVIFNAYDPGPPAIALGARSLGVKCFDGGPATFDDGPSIQRVIDLARAWQKMNGASMEVDLSPGDCQLRAPLDFSGLHNFTFDGGGAQLNWHGSGGIELDK